MPTSNPTMSHNLEINTHPTFRLQEMHPQTNVTRQPLHQIPPDFDQSVAEPFRYQTKLAHSIQYLHQQTPDELHDISKS